MKADILIAGGGIGGTVLAALLVRGGRKVTVLERSFGPPPFLRPEILWPAAVETLCGIRGRAFWEERCIRPLGGISVNRAGKWRNAVTRDSLERSGAGPFLAQPNQLRETLLAICGADVLRGVEVTEVLREDGKISGVRVHNVKSGASFAAEAALTVGDDGVHSTIRSAAGIGIRLRPFPVDFFVRGIPKPQAMLDDVVKLWMVSRTERSGLLAFGMMPVPGAEAACLAAVCSSAADDTAAIKRAFEELFPNPQDAPVPLDTLDFPNGFKRIRREWGHAESYGAPGAVLLGDALHPVSPAGGQGANMAVADAAVLARLILTDQPNLVVAYENERRRPNERGMRPSRLGTRLFSFTKIPVLGALPGLIIPELIARPSLFTALLRFFARAGANP